MLFLDYVAYGKGALCPVKWLGYESGLKRVGRIFVRLYFRQAKENPHEEGYLFSAGLGIFVT